jgi:hypothetical protein
VLTTRSKVDILGSFNKHISFDKKVGAMARPLRLEFPGAIYHLTGRGDARQKVFLLAPTASCF